MEEEENEGRGLLWRTIITAVLLSAGMLLPLQGTTRLLVFLLPYAVISYEVVWTAIKNIFHGELLDENFLMTIASVGAFCIGEYPEAVAVMLFYAVGELFEDAAVGKSRRSIAELMQIRPDYANVLRDGAEQKVAPETVAVGETILVRPYEKIPLDGDILEGETAVDASALTGESLPQDKKPGDAVASGTVNLTGMIKVEVRSVFGESTVAKILDLVENASEKKTRQEDFITRFARWYTPCVVAAAVLLAVIAPLFFGQPWDDWVRRALVFLVVSCPCALVISVPLSFFGGIGGASKKGILIKGSTYLEALSKADTFVFDKTGTLTKGSFRVVDVHPEEISEEELLGYAAAAESFSGHPIAASILKANSRRIDPDRFGEVAELPGRGMKAVYDGKTVCVGNCALMDDIGADWHDCELTGTIVHVSVNCKYMGHIIISDEPKPDSAATVAGLQRAGVARVVMLTGDKKAVGEAVAKELGVPEVFAELLPADKVAKVEALLAEKPEGTTLAFVGDGVNDAPVLTRADVGVAMGALGSDAAIEAADVVLMDDKPSKLVTALAISRKTMRIVRENIVFALAVKAVILALGALGIATMWLAVFGDVGVLILAVLNAMRTLNVKEFGAE